MTELERFLAVVRFEKPDYHPSLTAWGVGGAHKGGLLKLQREGLPQSVNDLESWCRYWGQCTFETTGHIATDIPEIKTESSKRKSSTAATTTASKPS